ncbi:Uma2 family endonuclease [Streptomonospora litoralis]|uniref:Putative restriction endonuclease domain-containing protein n=1 Tax=Streptomonospora litoralis TaxID=2498135 RepID=A0A4P6Q4T4_9ACTN|nr:Uma2 family endonuclease [Streptomonospora litoralis]QBI53979.1 hypothetical protein EKD16_10970 [Streptomonospora litoralis]
MSTPVSAAEHDLAALADHLDPPEGYRVEIIAANLVVSPTPVGPRIKIASRLQYALRDVLTPDLEIAQTATLVIPHTGERYVPDLVVLPETLLDEHIWKFPATQALLAVEITSPGNAETDRVKKPRGYALGEVPAYLLIDTEHGRWTLFEEPERGVYQRQTQVNTGAKLLLPHPFTGPVDTARIV